MMKSTFIALILSFFYLTASSQSCLPEGIAFTSQSQIDSFQIYYPNCTQIEGDVVINGNDIDNLTGLNVLTSVEGDLDIGVLYEGNPALTSLTGLSNLTSIGGKLWIIFNPSLTDLSGLEGLTSITLDLAVGYNDALTNLSGLDNITSVGVLALDANIALTSLTGLEGLVSIEETLEIWENEVLASLAGLESLTSIGGELSIYWNDSLTSLTGLDNLTSAQTLDIHSNDALTSLAGLENLTSIGDKLIINFNPKLSSLSGLDNLTHIAGNLWIQFNEVLLSLAGLENVTSIGGELRINDNVALTSLMGLDNIDAASINDLGIYFNSSLSTCEVNSICDYLANPTGLISINDNAPGCNSQEEVQDSCEAHAGYINMELSNDKIFVYPNPAINELNISADGYTIEEVNIYTLTRQQLMKARPENGTLDISHLQPGMYIVEVTIQSVKLREKLVVE